jgi:hypothetical protein
LVDRFLEHIIFIGLVINLVVPSIKINNFGLGLITICSIILMFFIPMMLLNGKIRISSFVSLYAIILISIYSSIQYSYIVLGVEESNGDFMEFFRYFQILPYLVFGIYIDYDRFQQKLVSYSVISILIISIICILEITNFSNLALFIGTLYSTPDHIQAMLSSSHRIIGTGSDPNVGALIIVFFLTIATLYRDKGILSSSYLRGILFIFLMFTQSRTVILGAFFSYSYFFIQLYKSSFIKKVIIASFVLLFITSVLYIIDIRYIVDGIRLAGVGQDESVNVRMKNYYNAFTRFNESPIFGWGPAKAVHSTVIDGDYALIIQRYGSFGIFVNLIFLSLYFFKINKLRKMKYNILIDFPNISMIIMIIGLFVMASNSFFSGYQSVSIPTIIAIGLIALSKKEKRKPIDT